MASINFIDQETVIPATWLNETDALVWDVFGGATTDAQARTNIGIVDYDISLSTVAATSKVTPIDTDLIPIMDSAASNILKKLTWENLKATLKSYLDGFYSTFGTIQNQTYTAFTTTGTLSALVLTPSPAYSAAAEFQQIEGELHVALTGGAVTLKVSAQAAIPVTNPDGSNPLAPLGYKAVFELNSSAAAWILTNPPVNTGLSNFTASVASNILTFNVQPDVLEFRSATLNGGVPQLISSPLATLAIPDTATMGGNPVITSASATMAGTTTLTLNAAPSNPVQVGAVIFQGGARIGKVASLGTYIGGVGTGTVILDASATFTAVAIVVVNPHYVIVGRMANGELFAVNQSGGVRLDEAGFISTTAVSASSDSNNVIYSTIARTNQAYKLLFLCQIANPTLGTHTIAPEAVIPLNSATLATMMGVGVGQKYTDMATQRVFGLTYYNLDYKPIGIQHNSNHTTSTFSTLTIDGTALNIIQGMNAAALACSLTGIIPAGQSCSIGSNGASNTWKELK